MPWRDEHFEPRMLWKGMGAPPFDPPFRELEKHTVSRVALIQQSVDWWAFGHPYPLFLKNTSRLLFTGLLLILCILTGAFCKFFYHIAFSRIQIKSYMMSKQDKSLWFKNEPKQIVFVQFSKGHFYSLIFSKCQFLPFTSKKDLVTHCWWR